MEVRIPEGPGTAKVLGTGSVSLDSLLPSALPFFSGKNTHVHQWPRRRMWSYPLGDLLDFVRAGQLLG